MNQAQIDSIDGLGAMAADAIKGIVRKTCPLSRWIKDITSIGVADGHITISSKCRVES